MARAARQPHPTDRWLRQVREQRQGLLAKIHIAKKQLGLTQEEYEAILSGLTVETGVRKGQPAWSAAELSMNQLESGVRYMKYLGWKAYRPRRRAPVEKKITALQDRCRELAGQIENGEQRLAGLVKSKGGVDTLAWLRDTAKLKQILAILEKYRQGTGVRSKE